MNISIKGEIQAKSEKNRGIKINNVWYNYPEHLENFIKDINKGDKVEVKCSDKKILFIQKITQEEPFKISEEKIITTSLRVKTITARTPETFDEQINKFCSENEIFDIKISNSIIGNDPFTQIFCATIIYWELKKDEQKNS